LIAIIFQARELRSSLENQKEAIKNQTQTIKLQNQTNLISAYTSRINFLLNDNDRIENSIKELKQNTNRKEELFNNLAKKKSKQLNEIKDIDLKIKKILDEIV
jgi:ABC-type siderophore export system fused ATPase/permease subunit